MKELTFSAPLKMHKRGGAYVEVPFDVEKELGSKRPKIRALINGIEYRGLLVRMKTPCHILGVLKGIRAQLNVNEADTIHVKIKLDTQERIVEISNSLKARLIDENLLDKFNGLAYTHRKEFSRWLREAKKEETKDRRLEKAIELLKSNKTLS